MQNELPAKSADQPTAEVITYAQFLSAKARRDLARVASGETPPHGYPWAHLFQPPAP